MTNSNKTERLHSMDALRAIMMLLGLVIHSAITYGVIDYGDSWSLKDPHSTHWTNDYIVSLIHAFRMQIFFFVAGFFGAMLFYERLPMRMVKNRFQRIVLPFIVFVFLLWPTISFSFTYTRLIFNDDPNAFEAAISSLTTLQGYIPQRTFHLWFLYYLALITGFSIIIAFIFKRSEGITSKISSLFNLILKNPILRIFIFAFLTAFVYLFMNTDSVSTSTSFIPDLNTFVYYVFFYLIGWVLFKSKHLLGSFTRIDWLSTISGLVLFTSYFFFKTEFTLWTAIAIKSVMVWCFIFGITGLFIRYFSWHSAVMRYISDASYWVYLIHLTFTAILPSFIMNWNMPSTLKFVLIMLVTFFICFSTYHYFVRNSLIGKFLNGRRYSKKLSDIKPQTAATVRLAD